MIRLITRLAISGLVSSLPIQAAITTYSNNGSFSTASLALGAAATTLENFGSESPGLLPMDTPVSFNGFTASASNVGADDMGFYVASNNYAGAQYAPFTSSQYLGWGEESEFGGHNGGLAPDITLTFGPNVRAFGFDYLDSDSTDETRIFVNGIEIGLGGNGDAFTPTTNLSFRGVTYYGIVSDTDILTVEFKGTGPGGFVDAQGIDNIQIVTIVPEPSSTALLGLGAAGLLLRRRRS